MGTHYLKAKVYFARNDVYLGYHVIDGGYNDPESWTEVGNGRHKGKKCRVFTLYVRDEGKPFERYAEEALNAYHKWLDEGNRLWVRKERTKK